MFQAKRLLIKRDTRAWSKITTSIHKAQKHITILVVGQKTRTEDIITRRGVLHEKQIVNNNNNIIVIKSIIYIFNKYLTLH